MFKIDVNVPQHEQIVGVRQRKTGDLLLKNWQNNVKKIVSVSDQAHPGIIRSLCFFKAC